MEFSLAQHCLFQPVAVFVVVLESTQISFLERLQHEFVRLLHQCAIFSILGVAAFHLGSVGAECAAVHQLSTVVVVHRDVHEHPSVVPALVDAGWQSIEGAIVGVLEDAEVGGLHRHFQHISSRIVLVGDFRGE